MYMHAQINITTIQHLHMHKYMYQCIYMYMYIILQVHILSLSLQDISKGNNNTTSQGIQIHIY